MNYNIPDVGMGVERRCLEDSVPITPMHTTLQIPIKEVPKNPLPLALDGQDNGVATYWFECERDIAYSSPQLQLECTAAQLTTLATRDDLRVEWRTGGSTICHLSLPLILFLNRMCVAQQHMRRDMRRHLCAVYTMLRGELGAWQHDSNMIISFLLLQQFGPSAWMLPNGRSREWTSAVKATHHIPLCLPMQDRCRPMFQEMKLVATLPAKIGATARVVANQVDKYDNGEMCENWITQWQRCVDWPEADSMCETSSARACVFNLDISHIGYCFAMRLDGEHNIDSFALKLNNLVAITGPLTRLGQGWFAFTTDPGLAARDAINMTRFDAAGRYLYATKFDGIVLKLYNSNGDDLQLPSKIMVHWQYLNVIRDCSGLSGVVFC